MNFKNKNQKGFTLIELMVVISIITLLSSVVLSSLRTARTRAKDTAVKNQLNQVAVLMNLNYNDHGNYCNDSITWITDVSSCAVSNFSGNYASKMSEICRAVVENATPSAVGPNYKILLYTTGSCNVVFSWAASLSNGDWYCVGSKARSTAPNYSGHPGCYDTE